MEDNFGQQYICKSTMTLYCYDECWTDETLFMAFGLHCSSILNELNVINGLPPDVMHDLLEGVFRG
jgi:hypothetical protein